VKFVSRTVTRIDRHLLQTEGARPSVFELVEDRLAAVEVLFRESLASPLEIVGEVGGYVADGGGKRVRPALHLLCARMCDYEGPHDVLLATVLELIHTATLIHDDIIDEAPTRRGRPSVNSRYGSNFAVLFGDYMLAKAMEMALRAENLRVMDKLAEITLRMTEGEMLQTRYVGRLDITESEYLGLVERKTGVLFAGCCEIAGILAGIDDDSRKRLRQYGNLLGLAFQLVDDLLDFTGDARTLGKPAASDLREGKVTYALIDLLSRGSAEAAELARRILDHGEKAAAEIEALKRLLDSSGALARTRRRARKTAEAASELLEPFPRGAAKQLLQSLPVLLTARDR
jgi:octaprenyl-diphosphate synthase